MLESNIDFLKSSVARGDPEYGILSMASDVLDDLRTHLLGRTFHGEHRNEFNNAMNGVITSLEKLDFLINPARDNPEKQ